MSGSKYLDRIAAAVTALTLILTILLMHGAALGVEAAAHTMGYETRLFDNSKVHTLDIVMDNWEDLIANAAEEEYDSASVIIDGEAYRNVGIRAKGNTSLSTVAAMDSDRYSFKIEFDHYDESQSYYGLDKLSLNNLIQDSTMMKDYLTYTMMNAFGVHAPLCSYVYITVNGEDWGLYLAVEGVEEAFLARNYGSDYGELYKPDSMDVGGGTETPQDVTRVEPDTASEPENRRTQTDLPEASGGKGRERGGGNGTAASDVKLQYIDDAQSSYTNIWDNAKTDVTEADQNRLIQSLKQLSSGTDLESVVDMEQVIRYFVVHNYVCNGDSYTGSMVHNYYLYEKDGQLSMIPWDYNLAFGTFQGGNASDVINTPIDAPVENGTGEDRPMWNWIVSDETYTAWYHQYVSEFLDSVDITGIIDQAYDLIRDYVAKDPTAFYSEAEFETGVETLRQFCALRSESITQQLATGETTQDMAYADASAITLSDMGSMGGEQTGSRENLPDADTMQGSQSAPEVPADAAPTENLPESTTEPQAGEPPAMPELAEPGDTEAPADGTFPEMPDEPSGERDGTAPPSDDRMQPTAETVPMEREMTASVGTDATVWVWLAVSVVALAIGLLVAKQYKR